MKLEMVLEVLGFGIVIQVVDVMLKVWSIRIPLMMNYNKNGFGQRDMALNR
jgi:microcompartment protein CcmL/EutN